MVIQVQWTVVCRYIASMRQGSWLHAEPCIKLGHVHQAKLCCKLKTHAAGSANNAAIPWMHATSQHHCATPIQDCNELVTTGMVSCVAWACHIGKTAAQQCKHYTNRVAMSGYWNTVKASVQHFLKPHASLLGLQAVQSHLQQSECTARGIPAMEQCSGTSRCPLLPSSGETALQSCKVYCIAMAQLVL